MSKEIVAAAPSRLTDVLASLASLNPSVSFAPRVGRAGGIPMAYVTVTARGGTEEECGRVRDVLVSHFEDAWGEIVVELTYDGACWRVDLAWWKVAGASLRQDCRDQVASALSMAHIAFRRPRDPVSPFPDPRTKLW